MRQNKAINFLNGWAQQDSTLFTSSELGMLFNEDGPTLRSTIARMEESGTIERIARNLYHYKLAATPDEALLDKIAVRLRRGHYCYESLESAASKWGIISQIPPDRLTVVTTGREGEFYTPYGTVEFVHTNANATQIHGHVVQRPNSPLPIATKQFTAENLKRCHRSTHLIDWEEVNRV